MREVIQIRCKCKSFSFFFTACLSSFSILYLIVGSIFGALLTASILFTATFFTATFFTATI